MCRPQGRRGTVPRQIQHARVKGGHPGRHEDTQAMGHAGRATRTHPSTVDNHDPVAPTGQDETSINSSDHPTAPPRLARDMVPWHLATTVREDHLTGEESRIASKGQTPPHASST